MHLLDSDLWRLIQIHIDQWPHREAVGKACMVASCTGRTKSVRLEAELTASARCRALQHQRLPQLQLLMMLSPVNNLVAVSFSCNWSSAFVGCELPGRNSQMTSRFQLHSWA